MKTEKQNITLEADNRANLEKKIVEHFSLGYRAISEVKKFENGKFKIDLKYYKL